MPALRAPTPARRATALLSLTLLACGDAATAPPADEAPPGVVRAVALAVDALGIPGAVVAVRREGGGGYVVARGVADRETRRPMTAELAFRAGSLTKPMVATAVLQLVDEGRLSLDDPVERHLAGVVRDGARVTVRQLLAHTSGLPDYADDEALLAALAADPARRWAPRELLAAAFDEPSAFAPGAAGRWAYANTNYVALGLLVERLDGRPLAEALRRRVFGPLGMAETFLGVGPSIGVPFAQGYLDLDAGRDLPVGTLLDPSWAWAAGGVVSTAGDLARFAEALARGETLRAGTQAARLARTPGSLVRLPYDPYDRWYGLGVVLGGGWVGHDGAIPGYEAEAAARPGVGAIAVLVNTSNVPGAAGALWAAVRDAELASRGPLASDAGPR